MARVESYYELQRGELLLGLYEPGTRIATSFDWVGDVSVLGMNIEKNVIENFASYEADRSKNFSVETMTNINGSFTTKTISMENLARAFGQNSLSEITQSATTAASENFTVRKAGARLQLGVSEGTPMGVRGVENVVLTRTVGGALVEGTDYEVDAENGMVLLNDEGSVIVGDVLTATYDVAASTFERIIPRTSSVRCAMRFITKNRTGQQKIYFAPCVVIRPTGDITMITEDNLAELQFTISVEKLIGMELMYVDGKPFTG